MSMSALSRSRMLMQLAQEVVSVNVWMSLHEIWLEMVSEAMGLSLIHICAGKAVEEGHVHVRRTHRHIPGDDRRLARRQGEDALSLIHILSARLPVWCTASARRIGARPSEAR